MAQLVMGNDETSPSIFMMRVLPDAGMFVGRKFLLGKARLASFDVALGGLGCG
jgi:hypothetical protein